jgi:hypothetical protein
LSAEWLVASGGRRGAAPLAAGLLGMALAYLGAEPSPAAGEASGRRGLVWIGGLALIPVTLFLVVSAQGRLSLEPLTAVHMVFGWATALGVPLAVGYLLRKGDVAPVALGLAWAALGATVAAAGRGVIPYLWCAGLAIGLIAWGLKDRRETLVNLGMAGFALTVTIYYFSDVMDRLGRSASLIGMGLLFLGGGYLLERARRGLMARLEEAA